jgi:hypothetical protein
MEQKFAKVTLQCGISGTTYSIMNKQKNDYTVRTNMSRSVLFVRRRFRGHVVLREWSLIVGSARQTEVKYKAQGSRAFFNSCDKVIASH